MVACWGWRRGSAYRAQGKQVLVMERGYIGDRFKWTSLAWNGLNNKGDFCLPAVLPGGRFEKHHGHLLQEWSDKGHYALVMGQVPGDASLCGQDLRPWYQEAAAEAAKAYRLPVWFRPHPVALQRGKHRSSGLPEKVGDLKSALNGAGIVVTWNSNAAVDAVLAGVPAVTTEHGSMAWDVTGHEIGDLCRPDRSAWAERLAWCQWTGEEMQAGQPWEFLRTHLNA